ncbi:hypothetical protein JCM18237_30280 [Halorubrum luteum]
MRDVSIDGSEDGPRPGFETPTRVAGPFDVVVVLEDTRGPASATATGRAERAIRRLDAFVHGVDPDGTPHESIDELLGGVAHLDAHESVEPLIDAIVEMADDRESTARDLRQEGLDEAE